MNAHRVARIVMLVMGLVAGLSLAGLVSMVVISGGKFNEYGEVPIPGSAVIELPEGTVIVSFLVRKSGSGTTFPPLRLHIEPPAGGRDPQVVEDPGASTVVNDDLRRQVWVMQVPEAGRYPVSIDGPVADYQNPRLAFGTDRALDGPIWVLVALSVMSMDLAIAGWWFQRRAKATAKPEPAIATDPYIPTDEGVRLEQLKTITALRDSGALTEDEFQAEKRRILKGQ